MSASRGSALGSFRIGTPVSRHSHRAAVQAALLAGPLVAAALGASACGGGSTDPPRQATPATPRKSPVASPSPASGSRALQPGPPWTRDALLEHLAGRRIRANGRTVRIDAGTVTCGGLGRPSRDRRDKPAWTAFRCTQPTFPSGSVAGPDLIFVVQSVAPRKLVVTRRHFTSY